MPKLMNTTGMQTHSLQAMPSFQYSAVRIGSLGAAEYTLVTIAVDVSGSVGPFAADLLTCLRHAVQACKASPRADNLLLRVVLFNQQVDEVHGFRPAAEINPVKDYKALLTGGNTALCDAAYSSVGATVAFGKALAAQDYGVNGILFVITDGEDNDSKTTPAMVRAEAEAAVTGEHLESLLSVLIGINVGQCRHTLEVFQKAAGMTRFVDAGNADPARLARLADFVSRSIAAQSQALGTGGPSQSLVI